MGRGTSSAMFAEMSKVVKLKEVTMSGPQLLEKIHAMANDIMSVLAWSHTSSLLLLRHFKWNGDALKERYFEDPDRVLKQSKIDNSPDAFEKVVKEAECGLCWEDVEAGDSHKLGCNHIFCTGCWKGHLNYHLRNDGANSITVRCPQKGCANFCGETAIVGVFGKNSAQQLKYQTFLLDLYANKTSGAARAPLRPATTSFSTRRRRRTRAATSASSATTATSARASGVGRRTTGRRAVT